MVILFKNVRSNKINLKLARSIIFDCERMKYPNTGLHSFCKGLGEALYNKAIEQQGELSFYIPASLKGAFGNRANYIVQKSIHKLVMPTLAINSIWHVAHQQSDYFPKKNKKGIVLTVHDLNFLYAEDKTTAKRKSYLKDLQKKIDRSAAVVTVSKFTANELEREIQLNGKKPIVVYNGVANHFHGLHSPASLPGAPFIFSIGTIAKKKNFHVLPALLVGNDFQLIIAGETREPQYREEIIAAARRLNVVNRVHIVGAIDEATKNWYYQHCLVVAFPSLAEGFGLPVIEAMRFGKQVLLSRAASLPEIGGTVANYFDSFEPEHMRAQFLKLVAQAGNTAIASAITNYAMQFSWETAANDYWKIYKSLQ